MYKIISIWKIRFSITYCTRMYVPQSYKSIFRFEKAIRNVAKRTDAPSFDLVLPHNIATTAS